MARWNKAIWMLFILLVLVMVICACSSTRLPGGQPEPTPNFQQLYDIDYKQIQLGTATFYCDLHGGFQDIKGDDNLNDATTFDDNVWGKSENNTQPGHYYPTAIAIPKNHVLTLSTTTFDAKNPDNALILGSGGIAATDAQIKSHAIWMGLLVNEPNTFTSVDGTTDRWRVSPLAEEYYPYIAQMPESASFTCNGNPGSGKSGTYCWVLNDSWVASEKWEIFGAYEGEDGNWYSGFNGTYP